MTDKERIERHLQTLMHLKNALGNLKEMVENKRYGSYEVVDKIDKIRNTIEFVISQNADQINLDL